MNVDANGLLMQILDHLPFGIWGKTKDGRFSFVNTYGCEITGKKREELLGKTDTEVWEQKQALHYRADDMVAMGSHKPVVIIEELPNGRTYETTKVRIILDGEVSGTVGFCRDITEELVFRRNIESSIQRLESLLGES